MNNPLYKIQQKLVENFNAERIQNITTDLWNSASTVHNNVSDYVGNVYGQIPGRFQWPYSSFTTIRDSVTLLVDISPENRLYLQNEAERELNAIVAEKSCQINLNLPTNIHEVNDYSQTTITGAPEAVRDSYLAIRQLLPITVWLEITLISTLPSILDPNTQSLKDIQHRNGVTICVVPIQPAVIQATPSNHIHIYVRTQKGKEEDLMRAVDELRQLVENNNCGNVRPIIHSKIDVPNNRPEIIGRSHSLLDSIQSKTSTEILVQRSASNLMTHLQISGHDYQSVSNARLEINDRFVVELNFDLNATQSRTLENFGRQLERIGEEYIVHILMKPSGQPANRTLIIRGTDKEVLKLFEVRQLIRNLIQNQTNAAQNLVNSLANSLPNWNHH